MQCWCNKEITDKVNKNNRFCSRCGVRLFQRCPYCGYEVQADSKKCEHCKKPFLFCPTCHNIYKIEEMYCHTLGCENKKLVESFNFYNTVLANDNCTKFISEEVFDNNVTTEKGIIDVANSLKENRITISRVLTRHGLYIFACGDQQGKSKLCAVDESSNKIIWSSNNPRNYNLAAMTPLVFKQYVCSTDFENTYVDSILDGTPIGETPSCYKNLAVMLLGNTLIIQGIDNNDNQEQEVLYFYKITSQLEDGRKEIIGSGSLNNDINYYRTPCPVYDDDFVYFANSHHDIFRTDEYGNIEHIWENHKKLLTLQLIRQSNYLFILAQKPEGGFILLRKSLTKDETEKDETEAESIASWDILAYPRIAVHNDYTFLCEYKKEYSNGAGANILSVYRNQFSQEMLWQKPLPANSKIEDFFVIERQGTYHLIYMYEKSWPKCYSVNSDVVDLNKPDAVVTKPSYHDISISEAPGLIYSNSKIIACSRNSGKFYWAVLEH